MNWPPKPGELWVAQGEWPRTVHEPSVHIGLGDVFLVVRAGRVVVEELSPGNIGLQEFTSYKSVSLEVIAHGIKRMIISECVDGKLDMNPVEQTQESSTI
jgi:hypothetical protein